jgi:N-acetylmuramoyl-L-alanine amidase
MKNIPSPNFNFRPEESIVDSIIIHYTVINQIETINKFCDPRSKVSSHYFINKSGEIIIFVKTDKRAWHAGVSSWKKQSNLNNNSIGVELENNGKEKFTIAQYEALLTIITQLKKEFSNIKDELILGHSDIAPLRKSDPGIFFAWEKILPKAAYHHIKLPVNNYPLIKLGEASEKVTQCQKLLDKIGYEVDINGLFDANLAQIIHAFKSHFCRKKIDDIWDNYAEITAKTL